MTMQPDRPFEAPEAEQGVIGALMRDPELAAPIGAFLDASHFADQDMSALYQLALMACAKDQKPDAITLDELCAWLPSGAPTMATAGRIQVSVTSTANAQVYARIIVERFKARKMAEVAQKISELAGSRGRINDQIASAQALVMDLMAADESPDVATMKEALTDVYEEMEARKSGTLQMGHKFGLKDLDDIVQGCRPGNLVIIAGRPGTGKTVLGMNLAENISVRNKGSVLVFSLEMSKAELAKRSLASISGVHQGRIDDGTALDEEETSSSVVAAFGRLCETDVRICEKPALTFSRIAAIARFQHRAKPLDAIVIDYIGLISSESTSKHQNRNQELGAISRGMKALAKELGLPVVALAQLNRGIESRTDAKPRMSDLRDSGEIEQDADVIIMAHRDEDPQRGQQGVTDIEVVKVRHAKPGSTALQFQGEFARFVCCAPEYMAPRDPEPETSRKSARSMLRGVPR